MIPLETQLVLGYVYIFGVHTWTEVIPRLSEASLSVCLLSLVIPSRSLLRLKKCPSLIMQKGRRGIPQPLLFPFIPSRWLDGWMGGWVSAANLEFASERKTCA